MTQRRRPERRRRRRRLWRWWLYVFSYPVTFQVADGFLPLCACCVFQQLHLSLSLSVCCVCIVRLAQTRARRSVAARLLFMGTSLPLQPQSPIKMLRWYGCHMRAGIDATICLRMCECSRRLPVLTHTCRTVSRQSKRHIQFCVSHLPIENGLCKSAYSNTVRTHHYYFISFPFVIICFSFFFT